LQRDKTETMQRGYLFWPSRQYRLAQRLRLTKSTRAKMRERRCQCLLHANLIGPSGRDTANPNGIAAR
jgi:hypothetical protein